VAPVSLKERVLENPLVFRLVQAPFTRKKLLPVLAHNDLRTIRRVLDVGCGPGTNTALFAGVDYTGMDINPAYIRQAQRRFRRNFVVADVTRYRVSSAERYDFIFVNSLLHHLPDDAVRNLLQHLSSLLTSDGHIHILELVLPEQPLLARKMAQWDRGKYARPLAQWELLFQSAFQSAVFEPYPVRVAGLEALSMVYFKGCPAVSAA
jgi:SAM-dependent methyltransferase